MLGLKRCYQLKSDPEPSKSREGHRLLSSNSRIVQLRVRIQTEVIVAVIEGVVVVEVTEGAVVEVIEGDEVALQAHLEPGQPIQQ